MPEQALGAEIDPMMIQSTILEAPIKGERTLTQEQLEDQAAKARQHTVAVDYYAVRGTCGDERKRVGLKNGEAVVEPRPSVFAGPTVYGLYIAETSGYFGESDMAAPDRLARVSRTLTDAKIKNGGHAHCAANAGLGVLFGVIGEGSKVVKDYAKHNLGDDYNDVAMQIAINNAKKAYKSGVYANWDESILPDVLDQEGDDSGEAIEILADVPHEGRTIIRNKIADTTVDQTSLHNDGGEDSFVFDDPYADVIEAPLTSGPNAVEASIVARHAREAFLAAVSGAVPNRELNQINQVR